MKTYKVLIVDDERLARKELSNLISQFPGLNLVGEAQSVDDAKLKISLHKPDIVFLDIQMPKKSGFDLLNEIVVDFKVIFVTAFDQFAIKAFEVNALDYILKPITFERLNTAILNINDNQVNNHKISPKLKYDDHLFVNHQDHANFIELSKIVYIESNGDYTMLVLNSGKRIPYRRTMQKWESILPSNKFIRIHRSHIINLNYLDKMEEGTNYSYSVFLKGINNRFIMSRRYAQHYKKLS